MAEKNRKNRHARRGAALVESIIVSALLMTFMAGGLFLHRLYLAQQKAINDARLTAWTQAMKGCNAAVDLQAIWLDACNGPPSTTIEMEPPAFFGAVSHTSGSASHSASAHARVGGGGYTLSASDSVACNEIANDDRGDAVGLIRYIGANVLPKF